MGMSETVTGSGWRLIKGGQGPLVIIGDSHERDGYAEAIVKECEALGAGGLDLMVFEVGDWDRDFSPWPARGMDEDHPLGDGGPSTLARLESEIVPLAKKELGDVPLIIGGYSLAGLFALWSFFESEAFEGAVCCSGSLWMDGWMPYMEEHKANRPGCVYLSLGGKEEKSPHPLLKTIGDCTRRADAILSKDPLLYAEKLEMNKGGHFADSAKRLAKGIVWALSAIEKQHKKTGL